MSGEQQHEDLDQWSPNYRPSQGIPPGPEILAPGPYDFLIESAELTTTTGSQPESLFRLNLCVLAGPQKGVRLSRPTFFRRQESLDYLGGDLITLGLDAQLWGRRGVAWSQELRAACPKLRGVCFAGQVKEFTKSNGEPGFDLLVRGRIASQGLPPGPTLDDDKVPF